VNAPAAAVSAPPVPVSANVARLLPGIVALTAAAVLGAAVAGNATTLIVVALVPLLLALLARPDNATLLFTAFFYMNIPVLVAHAGAGSVVASAFGLILLAPVVAQVVIARRTLVFTPVMGLMLGYLLAMMLSAVVAGHATQESASMISSFLVEGGVLVVLLVNALRTPELLRGVVWVLLGAGAMMGSVSLWQELTHSYHNTLGGFADVDSLTYKVQHGTSEELRPRLAGPIGEQNRYAQIMLVLLPLAVWAIRTESRKVLRLAAAGCAGLILCGQLLSFSRGAVVALVVLMVAMVVSGFIRLRHFVAVALAFVALIAVVAPDLILRVQSIEKAGTATSQTDTQADNATRGRVTIQLAALHVIRDHPLIGVGPGEFFNTYSKQYANALDLDFQQSRRRAHNLYLEIAADTGIVGLAAFLSILAVTMVQLRRLSRFWRRRQPVYAELAQALFLSLVAYMASAVFLQLSYQRYFWFLIGISNATIWILSRAARQSVPPQRGGQP
jgi:hypothetical protein